MIRNCLSTSLLLACLAPLAHATHVQPSMGGGEVGEGSAPMKHADISFDGQRLTVDIDDTVGVPWLRPLTPPAQFDPEGPWGVINGKAYNFQYGWNPSRFDDYPPIGSWVWIEQLSASPGLEVYQRSPATPTGKPIFGTAGSSTRWRWSGVMTHNLYAIAQTNEDNYQAMYRVYIGDNVTGNPTPGYEPAQVTFEFLTTPHLPGDYNRDRVVDADDYSLWRETYGQSGPGLAADGNGDEVIDSADYTVWRDHLTSITPALRSASTPAPSAAWLLAVGCSLWTTRRQRTTTDHCQQTTSAHTQAPAKGRGLGAKEVMKVAAV